MWDKHYMRLIILSLIIFASSCSSSKNAPAIYNPPPISVTQTFEDMDTDGNGTISIDEFRSSPTSQAIDSSGPMFAFITIFLIVMLLCVGSSIRKRNKNG